MWRDWSTDLGPQYQFLNYFSKLYIFVPRLCFFTLWSITVGGFSSSCCAIITFCNTLDKFVSEKNPKKFSPIKPLMVGVLMRGGGFWKCLVIAATYSTYVQLSSLSLLIWYTSYLQENVRSICDFLPHLVLYLWRKYVYIGCSKLPYLTLHFLLR